MQGELNRLTCCALLSGLLLAACNTIPEGELALSEGEFLGTHEAALCSGLSVTTLTMLGASIYQGELAASGDWAVSTGANAIRLEYYVDGSLYAYDERIGSSGTWYFSASGISCNVQHSFLVKGMPMVIDSNGNRTVCVYSSRTASQNVIEYCPCGNGVCDPDETTTSCPWDCCVNGYCSDGTCCLSTGRCSDGRYCMF